MANKRNNPKRDHHVLPELYLKGFVIKEDEPFIWVYKRGEQYNPGQGKMTNNPFKDSIRRTKVERDFYADLRAIPAAQESFLVETLQKMTWHFFTAPQSHAFLTGDNPVFIPEQHGLGKNVSELSFPISTNVALVASWHRELREGFLKAAPQVVKELNRRTAHKASRCLYFSKNLEWVVTLLNKSIYKFCPMHSAKSVFTVVKLVTDGPESKPHLIFSM